jgi:hypothetical protein
MNKYSLNIIRSTRLRGFSLLAFDDTTMNSIYSINEEYFSILLFAGLRSTNPLIISCSKDQDIAWG